MIRKLILSKKESEQAKVWRINKCGYNSFDRLFKVFSKEVKLNEKN